LEAEEDVMTIEEPPVSATALHKRETLHQEAERIAVPNFDWIAAPADGMADAFSALSHPHPRAHHPIAGELPPAPA
jgi:hypothetical protein